MADWREALLNGVQFEPAGALDGVQWGRTRIGRTEVVVAAWNFAAYGGSFGTAASRAFAVACDTAAREARPLISLVRSGGTRLHEGVPALAGMARAVLALQRLAAAGVSHLAIADQPTTGGVWVTVASRADLRAAVAGSTVGFAGPRVVEATTGTNPSPASHSAETAFSAGLVDALLPGEDVVTWLAGCLDVFTAAPPTTATSTRSRLASPPMPDRDPWAQVSATRVASRSAGSWLRDLLDGPVEIRGAGTASQSFLGRVDGGTVVAYALGSTPGAEPGVADYALLVRAAELAGRLGLPLVTAVDTPGADPRSASENAGIAPAIGAAISAVISCPSPTIAVLLGEGGSGGALAGLVCDRLWLVPDSYLAALVPEGAAAALRTTPEEAAAILQLRPSDIEPLPFCDGLLDPADARHSIGAALVTLSAEPPAQRLAERARRWS
jgi:acetyl-CoA carboxylase carboxyltransferase component